MNTYGSKQVQVEQEYRKITADGGRLSSQLELLVFLPLVSCT